MTGSVTGFKITDGKGFHITFKNGWTISVQFGPGNYCDNYDMDISSFYRSNRRMTIESTTAEIAYWGPDGEMQRFDKEEYADLNTRASSASPGSS